MNILFWLTCLLIIFASNAVAGVCDGIKNKEERMICIKTRNAAVKNMRRAAYSGQQVSRPATSSYSGRIQNAVVAKAQAKTGSASASANKLSALDVHKKKLDNTVSRYNPIETKGKRTIAGKKAKRAKRKQQVLQKLAHGKRTPTTRASSAPAGSAAPVRNTRAVSQSAHGTAPSDNRTPRIKTVAKSDTAQTQTTGQSRTKHAVRAYVPGEVSAKVADYTDGKSVMDVFDELY